MLSYQNGRKLDDSFESSSNKHDTSEQKTHVQNQYRLWKKYYIMSVVWCKIKIDNGKIEKQPKQQNQRRLLQIRNE